MFGGVAVVAGAVAVAGAGVGVGVEVGADWSRGRSGVLGGAVSVRGALPARELPPLPDERRVVLLLPLLLLLIHNINIPFINNLQYIVSTILFTLYYQSL